MLVILLVPIDEPLDPFLERGRWRVAKLLRSQGHICIGLEDVASWRHGHVISDGLLPPH